MCRFRSYIVTKDEVLGCRRSDSHENIIEDFGLDDSTATPNFVRVEISPLNRHKKYSLAIDDWFVNIDQDYLPEWLQACDKFEFKKRVHDRFLRDLENPVYMSIINNTPLSMDYTVEQRMYVAAELDWGALTRAQLLADTNSDVRKAALYTGTASLECPLWVHEEPAADARVLSISVRTNSVGTAPPGCAI